MYKNAEGYRAATEGEAIRRADWPSEDLSRANRLMKFAADCLGFEVVGRIGRGRIYPGPSG